MASFFNHLLVLNQMLKTRGKKSPEPRRIHHYVGNFQPLKLPPLPRLWQNPGFVPEVIWISMGSKSLPYRDRSNQFVYV